MVSSLENVTFRTFVRHVGRYKLAYAYFGRVFSIVFFLSLVWLIRATGFPYRDSLFQHSKTDKQTKAILKVPNNTRCLQTLLFARPFATFFSKNTKTEHPNSFKNWWLRFPGRINTNKYINWFKTSRVTRVFVFTHAP